ncbi:MAG TPA: aldo/keto reductase [Opitutaceae bacterium]|jgi:aryl-alcohol dehydrogenase-like predicted oxidoreductase|nr:aldo/keto reductase [Opitutaceae bacterium]
MRALGKSGIHVAPWALGGNVFGWTVKAEDSEAILDAFVGEGFNLIDTADVYSRWAPGNSGGESETIIGRWLRRRGRRDDVVIATKVGMDMGPDRTGLSRRWIVQAVEDSLRRLQTDHIDLYQSHRDDPDTPQEETLAAYAELIRSGKVRAIGASNFSADRLESALRLHREKNLPAYQTLQPNYNLADRADYEGKLEPFCVKEGLGVIAYFSLASGFLSGKYRSEADLQGRARASRVKQYLNPRGLKILAALDAVAAAHGARPAQIALAWLIARPSVTAPIASATSVEQVRELAAAARLRLTAEDIKALNNASTS